MRDAKLPGLVIIGAAKAATTWIAHQLRERPDVFLPGPEPHYFSREYARGHDWYAGWFADAADGQLIAEKSADYLADPNVPARMAALLPQVKLVAQLRNPVERAYSDYCMLFRRGQVSGDVARQLDRRTTDAPRFLDDGLYARHLRRFLDHFPREAIEIILYDEIRATPDAAAERVRRAAGLPPIDLPARIAERKNDSAAPLVPMAFRRLPAPVKRLVAPLRGNRLFEGARGLIARPVAYPPLTDDVRSRLVDFFHQDVEALGTMLGRDLGQWVTPPGSKA